MKTETLTIWQLCGLRAILQALDYANEKDPELRRTPNPTAIIEFVENARPRIFHECYPQQDGDETLEIEIDHIREYTPPSEKRQRVAELLKRGLSFRSISMRLKVSRGLVWRVSKQIKHLTATQAQAINPS